MWRTGSTGVVLAHAREGGEPRSKELFLSETARPSKRGPAVAWSGERYLVGWLEEQASGAASFRARRYTADLVEEGEVVPITDSEVTGEGLLGYADGRFVAVWASGADKGLLRHAVIDPETANVRKRIVGAGAGPFEELQMEPYAGGLLVSWRGGRIVIEADGEVRGLPSETGARPRDARPPSWTQHAAPELPETRSFGRGLPHEGRLLVPWLEDGEGGSRVVYAAFDESGARVGGPWEVARTDAGPSPVQVGIGPVGDRIAVVYYDGGGTTVRFATFAPCP